MFSKVLATLDGKNITQQQVDKARIGSLFSEKEMLEKIIDEELLFEKAKDLQISVSDKEAKTEVKKQRDMFNDIVKKADNKAEVKATMDDLIKKIGSNRGRILEYICCGSL